MWSKSKTGGNENTVNGLRQLFLINAFMLFGLSLAGCQSQVESATPAVAKVFPRRQDAWVLTCANAKASEPAYLSDGIIGMRFGRDGAGLPNTLLLAKHVNGYGEALAPLPSPLQADWKYDAGPVFSSATTYSQTLDLQIGLLRTHWQESAGNSFLNFICESFILPSQPVAAQRWRIDLPYDRYIEYENPVCPTLSRRLQSSLS